MIRSAEPGNARPSQALALAAWSSDPHSGWPTFRARPTSCFRVVQDSAGGLRSELIGLEAPGERGIRTHGDASATPVWARGLRFSHDPLGDLETILAATEDPGSSGTSGWLGWFSYELGSLIEPAAGQAAPVEDPGRPLIELFRVDSSSADGLAVGPSFHLGPFDPGPARECYVAMVERAIGSIHAGEIYQANLSHVLLAPFAGSSRRVWAELAAKTSPRFGAYIESPALSPAPARAIISLSPELFLRYTRADRRVVTEPMKGTRPAACDPEELRSSPKDTAELAMIIDLMRNDLARVCEAGSVRVEADRRISRHGSGVWQATGSVAGRLRVGLGVSDLIRAAFPAGSVTGAPKIQAMRTISTLERRSRGAYCGSVAWLPDSGDAVLNVAIRTAVIEGASPAPGEFEHATLSYPVGAGIVAQSDPDSEWRETLDKASVLLARGLQSRAFS